MIKRRILIVGCNGLLGQALAENFSRNRGDELLLASVEEKFVGDSNFTYVQLDISKRSETKKVVLDFFPDIVINAAAYTNVDGCEDNKELAWNINVSGVKYLVEGCRVVDAKLIHLSTDFVFDGMKGPYNELDKPNPISYYGRSKLGSENEIKIGGIPFAIIRTNVIYGIQKGVKKDFVQWVVENLRIEKQINVATDQMNNPTFVNDLVDGILLTLEKKRTGIYNIGGIELISRYDFAVKIAEVFDLDKILINPILTSQLKQKAKRPLNGGLIILKAQTELNYQPHSLEENLKHIRRNFGS
ncbi:MAG: SDR family oxidoreductase [Bacteroidetes bacterium]|nr:SDR family oxidoreductase [Bacteroidota bacterium]MBU2586347.1 SDR family oxidoreductase [Bacteroidota bacterium]